MATAPFLLLIVAALPRAEAAPIASTLTVQHETRVAVTTVVARAAVEHDDSQGAQVAIAAAPTTTKRAPKPKLIAALPTPPLEVETPPVLAARVEPGEPRGPPA